MILHRCFPFSARARVDAADGPLWFPRPLQGEGRHDNPDVYGCLYLADRPVSPVVEQLAAFRGQRLSASLLRRRGLPLALAEIEFDADAALIDLDDPPTLGREATEAIAGGDPAPRGHPAAGAGSLPAASGGGRTAVVVGMGIPVDERHRVRPRRAALRLLRTQVLTLDHPAVIEAAEVFALRIV